MWGRERDDVACVVVARYVLWVVERDWWARHYTGRVAVTSYGAANKPSLGVPTSLILCGPRAVKERQRKSLGSYSCVNSVSYHCNIVKVV